MTRPSERPIPDGISPIAGYRLFNVDRRRGELFSLWHRFRWIPRGRTEAQCGDPHDEIPQESCECGLYAMNSLTELVRFEPHFWLPGSSTPRVFIEAAEDARLVARVLLWGKVIEAEEGYRAQYGCLEALLPRYGQGTIAAKVAATYGVPVSEELLPPPVVALIGGPMDGYNYPLAARTGPDVIPIRSAGACWGRQVATLGRAEWLRRLYRLAVPDLPDPEWTAIRLRFGIEDGTPRSYEDAAAVSGVEPDRVHFLARLAASGLREIEDHHHAVCQRVFVYRRLPDADEWRYVGSEGECPLDGI